MKIRPEYNAHQNRINFKSQGNTKVLGYDDNTSKSKRDYIRKYHKEKCFPNLDIFEKEGRLEEWELNKLITTLTKSKICFVDDDKIDALNLSKCRPIGNNSYGGAMFNMYDIDKIPKLKRAGIRQIVDITCNDNVKNACRKAGIKYFAPLEICPGMPLLKTEEEAESDFLTLNYGVEDLSEQEFINMAKSVADRQKGDARAYVNDFVKFIQAMQRGYTYIGCDFGTYRTDNYIFFNSMFNPKARNSNLFYMPYMEEVYCADDAAKLYLNLTEEDKKKMGWTEEFEQEFLKKLDNYMK